VIFLVLCPFAPLAVEESIDFKGHSTEKDKVVNVYLVLKSIIKGRSAREPALEDLNIEGGVTFSTVFSESNK